MRKALSLSVARYFLLGWVAVGMGFASSAEAAVVTFKEGADNAFVTGYAGTESVTVLRYFNNPATFAAEADLKLDNNGGTNYRSIISFDLSSLAGQSINVTSATLRLFHRFYAASGQTADVTFGAYQIKDVNAGWTVGDVTGSFKSRTPDTPWIGGSIVSVLSGPFEAAPLDTAVFTLLGSNGDAMDLNVSPSLVQQWIDGVNAGVLLRPLNDTTTDEGRIGFYNSRAGGSQAIYRPELIITYDIVPEPATLGLLGAGGLLLLGRRR